MIFSMLILVPALADAYLGISPTLSAPSSFRLNRPVFVQNSLPWNLTFRHVSAPTLLEMSDSADMEAPSPSSALFPPIDKNALLSASILAAVPLLLLSQVSPAAIDVLHETTHAVTKIPADAWSTYAAALAAAPVRTKGATSGVVYALGDALSQKMEGREMGETDVWRMARSGAAGFLGHGPLSHLWYGASEGFFQAHPEIFGSWYGVLPKVVVDQTTWGPFWNNVYIVLLGVMCSASPKKILEDIKTTTVPLLVSGLKLWPLAHCVTYGLVPVEYRLLWVDLVEILWVTFLATAAANPGRAGDERGPGRAGSGEEEPGDVLMSNMS